MVDFGGVLIVKGVKICSQGDEDTFLLVQAGGFTGVHICQTPQVKHRNLSILLHVNSFSAKPQTTAHYSS